MSPNRAGGLRGLGLEILLVDVVVRGDSSVTLFEIVLGTMQVLRSWLWHPMDIGEDLGAHTINPRQRTDDLLLDFLSYSCVYKASR